jgi:4-hydroxybenzoate polyprenyltransferase
MPVAFSYRLLSVLQLTRMALVFTAIADGQCALLLWADWHAGVIGARYDQVLSPSRMLAVAVISVGLYGFGMSLNDIIDRRRDRQIASDRPLPSGRIGLIGAHVVCALLGLAALLAGAYLARRASSGGTLSFVLLVWTMGLISFYDFAGKYLVAPGLLTLGLIRFFHATIAAPQLPLLWHPLLLLNHVAILSTVAYAWEQKRPQLTRIHWWAVLGGLALVDATCVGLVWWRRHARRGYDFLGALDIESGLLIPAIAAAVFVMLAVGIRRRVGKSNGAAVDSRDAGRQLMLAGLLWLIVYDAAFAAGYVGLVPAIILLMLLPLAYVSVLFMRWWARIMLLSQRPEYQRAR